jgi:hypothetical protein
MQTQIRTIVHRNSNGSVELLPDTASGLDRIVVHALGTPSEKTFPVGGIVTLTLDSEPPAPQQAAEAPAPSEAKQASVAEQASRDALVDAIEASARPATTQERRSGAKP